MRAMVLAAGLGSRMAPLTQNTPKPLIPLNGRPFIFYTLKYLAYFGIEEVVINLHYLGEQIKSAIGDGSGFGVRITYSEEPVILGTGGGIKKAEAFLGREPFLVINSDILTDINLNRLFEYHRRKNGLASLVLREDPLIDRYGAVEIDGSGRIQKIVGKGKERAGPLKKRMFTGIHIIDPEVLKSVPPSVFHSITDTYIELILKDEPLFGLETDDYWADLGTIDQYREINDALVRGKIRLSYL